ncbi:MAG TPA: hypothetical protein VF916_06740 [Ktedonobacterales bacterium]|jgi:uncharacterized membrane protein
MPAFSLPTDPQDMRPDLTADTPQRSDGRPPSRSASAPAGPRRAHHPRALAALCYTVPVVPAWVLLVRERRNGFVRFHAAQSLIFYSLITVAQVSLYLAILFLGGRITSDRMATATAAVVLALYVALAAVVAYVWTQLVADCVRGRARRLPVAGRWALRLERFAPRRFWRSLRSR